MKASTLAIRHERDSALDTTGSAAGHELPDLVNCAEIHIPGYRMLEAGCSSSELERFMVGQAGMEAINQASSEGITRADTIHNICHFVAGAEEKLPAIMQAS